MIQIIGFIMSFYLFIKAIEFGTSNAYRTMPANRVKAEAIMAVVLLLLGAAGFAFWLFLQGASVPTYTPPPSFAS